MFADEMDEAAREVERIDRTQRFEDNRRAMAEHEAAVRAFLAAQGATMEREAHGVQTRRQLKRESDRTLPAFGPGAELGEVDFTALASAVADKDDPGPARRNGRPKKAQTARLAFGAAYEIRLLLQDGKPRSKADIRARFGLTDYAFRQAVEALGLVQTRDGFQGAVLYSLP